MQKHKGSNATVCLDKLACFMLEQMHMLNKNSPFQLLKHTLNFLKPFSTLSKHFKTFPKSYSNISWLLYCLIWNHNITATSISVDWSKHDIFYFFGKKSPASVFKVLAAGCYFDPENDCTENKSWVTDKGFKTKWWDNTCKLRDLKVVRCCHLTLGARSFSCAVSSFGKSLYSDLSFLAALPLMSSIVLVSCWKFKIWW